MVCSFEEVCTSLNVLYTDQRFKDVPGTSLGILSTEHIGLSLHTVSQQHSYIFP